MPRAKGGFKTRRRRKKILERAKGYNGGRSRLFRVATETVDKALQYAYRDRKALANLAYHDPKAFSQIAETVKSHLAA